MRGGACNSHLGGVWYNGEPNGKEHVLRKLNWVRVLYDKRTLVAPTSCEKNDFIAIGSLFWGPANHSPRILWGFSFSIPGLWMLRVSGLHGSRLLWSRGRKSFRSCRSNLQKSGVFLEWFPIIRSNYIVWGYRRVTPMHGNSHVGTFFAWFHRYRDVSSHRAPHLRL